MKRGVRAGSITLAIPDQSNHSNDEDDKLISEDLPIIYPDAFEDEHIESKIQKMLEEKGINIIRKVKLFEIISDADNKIERVAFKKIDELEEEEEDEDPELEGRSQTDRGSEMNSRNGESLEEENKS